MLLAVLVRANNGPDLRHLEIPHPAVKPIAMNYKPIKMISRMTIDKKNLLQLDLKCWLKSSLSSVFPARCGIILPKLCNFLESLTLTNKFTEHVKNHF